MATASLRAYNDFYDTQSGVYPESDDQDGEGFMDWINWGKRAHQTLKKHKVISRTAGILADAGIDKASKVRDIAAQHGYGTPERPLTARECSYMRGRGLVLAGSGLILAGQEGDGWRRGGVRTLDGTGKPQCGSGFLDFVKNVGRFLHKTKVISKVGDVLDEAGVPMAGKVSSAAKTVGLGKRKRKKKR